RRISIMGLEEARDLFRVIDMDGKLVALPEQGLVIAESLAGALALRVGDTVMVEVLEGERPVREIRVAATVKDFAGTSAYMSMSALNDFLQEGRVISGAFLRVDEGQLQEFYR